MKYTIKVNSKKLIKIINNKILKKKKLITTIPIDTVPSLLLCISLRSTATPLEGHSV